MTITRILYNLTPGKDSYKLKIILISVIIAQILSIIINAANLIQISLYLNCIAGGILLAPLYALSLSISG